MKGHQEVSVELSVVEPNTTVCGAEHQDTHHPKENETNQAEQCGVAGDTFVDQPNQESRSDNPPGRYSARSGSAARESVLCDA